MPPSAIHIHPPPPSRSLAIVPAPAPDPDADRAWRTLRAANPRLHDGPILLIDDQLRCTRATYRTLATATALGRDVRALGVQGVIVARDTLGHEHVLLGRRGAETRIYGGLWENAPSGGVAPPPPHVAELREPDLIDALRAEGLEELGIDLADSGTRWIAMLQDAQAMSTDVVLELRPREPIDPRAAPCRRDDSSNWEYIDTAWIATTDLPAWSRRHAQSISPPTRALLAHLTHT